MTEEISKLRQTFAETGVQLDRIIDAYERTPAFDPNYPRYLKFDFDAEFTMAIKIGQGQTIEEIKRPNDLQYILFDIRVENNYCYIQYKESEMVAEPFVDILKFDLSTFAITGDLYQYVQTANETWITEEQYNALSF